jgi:hypothetical protein
MDLKGDWPPWNGNMVTGWPLSIDEIQDWVRTLLNRLRLTLCLIVVQLVTSGCSKPHPARAPGITAPSKTVGTPRNDAVLELQQAIRDALVTKPTTIKVSITSLGTDPANLADMVQTDLLYALEDSAGYKQLVFRAQHRIGADQIPRTTVMAEHTDGDDVYKLITMSFDDDGRVTHTDAKETDKDKLSFLEKRCNEIRVALVGALSQKPAPQK